MKARVYKFGGASLRDATNIKNIVSIIQKYYHPKLVIVISAMGKTTNLLESLTRAYYYQQSNLHSEFDILKKNHVSLCDELFQDKNHSVYNELDELFQEIEWIVEEKPNESFDYIYDQIVSIGELLSSKIVSAYLNKQNMNSTWLDARDCIKTDNTYREGKILWNETQQHILKTIPILFNKGLVVTQGFIGCTSENFTTTLGREGSDYTGAIITWALDAESETIWKDVPGVLNADPRLFENTTKIDKLSYTEAIEMTYYGAQVIHPKTIQPLQNKNIPLHVRSFIQPDGSGTVIEKDELNQVLPPIIVVKKNQLVIHISTKNFSFVAEDNLGNIFQLIAKNKVKVNMMQNSAISFSICCDNVAERVSALLHDLESEYTIHTNEDVELYNVRHSVPSTIQALKENKKCLMEAIHGDTVQLIVKEFSPLKMK